MVQGYTYKQGSWKLRPSTSPVSDKVKVDRTNHVGQERSNWTYFQYKGHLTHIIETRNDCHMNLGQYLQIGHLLDKYGWTNCRGLDNYPKVLYHWTISKLFCQIIKRNIKIVQWIWLFQLDKHQFFPLHFLNRIWDNVFYVADPSCVNRCFV